MAITRHVLRGICAGALVLALSGAAAAASLRVTGEGVVSAAPDSAELRLSVVAAGPRAEVAMADLAERLGAVLARLREAGIPDSALQTTDLSLDPVFAPMNDRTGREAPRIDGYRARTGLSVEIARIDALGEVVDTALQAGANGFDGVRFTHSNPEPLRRLARTRAVEDAYAKARTYAEAAVVALGPVQEIVEGGGGGMPFPIAEMRMASPALELAPGELSFRETVTVVFEILPANP
jgi:hypothetical protein